MKAELIDQKKIFKVGKLSVASEKLGNTENKSLSSKTNWKYHHEKQNRRNDGYNKLTG